MIPAQTATLQVDVPNMLLLTSSSKVAVGSAGASEMTDGSPSAHPSHFRDLPPLNPEWGGQASFLASAWVGGHPPGGGAAQRQQVMSERCFKGGTWDGDSGGCQ